MIMQEKNRKWPLKSVFLLQLAVVIYSLNTVVAKLVAAAMNDALAVLSPGAGPGAKILALLQSPRFLLLLLGEFAVLGTYAILWQQLIKKFELSIAYANKAMTLLWSLLWSVLFFDGTISIAKLLGIFLVIAGTIVLNGGAND